MAPKNEPFCSNFAASLKRRHLRLSDVSARSGLSTSELSALKRGAREPTVSEAMAIAEGLGVPVEHLLASPRLPAILEQGEDTRLDLAKRFIETTILGHYRHLVTWQSVTNQSSQVDSGYLGQHLVSLLTGIAGRGEGSRGKGHDLDDGSEIKVASTLGGIDKPRWNNNIGAAGQLERYLGNPAIYFVLIDNAERAVPFPIRVRVWKVEPQRDTLFQQVARAWGDRESSGNFQLHPPCWSDADVVTNKCGNLRFPLLFRADQRVLGDVDYVETVLYDRDPGSCVPATEP